jgi:glyoxylase-like metal-dependent hydrolase (beta-lactamase superfamily II)
MSVHISDSSKGAILTEIMEGIHQVDGVNANVFLVIDGKELTVIDTGMPRNSRKILNYVHKIGRQPSDISRIVLTHCHADHVGSAHELVRLTNAKVAVHQEDADFVAGNKSLPGPKGATGILLKAFSFFFKSKPVQPDMVLKENDKVGSLTVIHTPGHTPGSISLLDTAGKVVFVGDTLMFDKGKISVPAKRFTLDMRQERLSIKKIAGLDFDVMLSGHGEPLKSDASSRVKEFSDTLK